MTTLDLALRFAAAVGLGILLGLERERTRSASFAGVRTFALVALLGATSAYLQVEFGLEWLGVAAFAAIALLVSIGYFHAAVEGKAGITTEVGVLLTFLLGALCAWGHVGLAAALAVTGTLLLAIKGWLHQLAQRIETPDVIATLKFAIITLIILPLLPNQNYGPPPLDVINPYRIWLMVVLISGLNFLSYILVKVMGGEHGLGLTGLLGGLVSSTAVTLGFSQRAQQEPGLAPAAALGIIAAWTVSFVRVLIAVGVVHLPLAVRLAPGVGLLAVVALVAAFMLWRASSAGVTARPTSGHNPFELGQAVKFGLLFGLILVVARAAEVYLGEVGLYLAGAVAGLTDVDAISLSMASLAARDSASLGPAARTVLIALLSNTVVKTGLAFSLGGTALRARVFPAAIALLAVGVLAALVVG